MKYSPKIEKAIKRASSAHDGQFRKGSLIGKLPYVSHLFSVASIISEYTNDEDMISAGLLHDILEDTDYAKEELLRDFGERVHGLVLSVTEGTKKEKLDMTWRQEKQNYIDNLKKAEAEASLISSADKIHNLLTSIENKTRMTRSPEEYDWFHTEVLKIIKEKLGNHPIVLVHEGVLAQVREEFK